MGGGPGSHRYLCACTQVDNSGLGQDAVLKTAAVHERGHLQAMPSIDVLKVSLNRPTPGVMRIEHPTGCDPDSQSLKPWGSWPPNTSSSSSPSPSPSSSSCAHLVSAWGAFLSSL